MDTRVPAPTIFQSQCPKNTNMKIIPIHTSDVSEHIFTLLNSHFSAFEIASGRPSPASIRESQRTSHAIPNARTAPPARSSRNLREYPASGFMSSGTCRKPVSHIVRSV